MPIVFASDFYQVYNGENAFKLVRSGEASPTIWSCYANLRELSLFISLEIDCFLGP